MEMTDEDIARVYRERPDVYAVAAVYDAAREAVMVELNTGVAIRFPAARIPDFAGAGASALSEIEISPSGLGLHWPALDADLYVPALLESVFGPKRDAGPGATDGRVGKAAAMG